MDKTARSLNCPNCGSYEINFISDDLAECKSCGSKFAINAKGERNVFVTNNFNLSSPSPDCVNYTVKNTTDAAGFTRNALIELACDADVPADIFQSEFQPATCEYDQFLAVNDNVEVSYSASIGYDREVTRSVYNRSTGKYDERKETVTEWEPITGIFKNEQTGIAVLKTSGSRRVQTERFVSLLLSRPDFVPTEEGNVPESPLIPSKSDYKSARGEAENAAVALCGANLPGERQKDFKASCVSDIKDSFVAIIPDRILKFSYNGKNCEVRGFACSNETCAVDVPSDKKNVREFMKNRFSPAKTAAIAIYAMCIIIALVSLFIPLEREPEIFVKIGLLLPLAVICIGYFVFYTLFLRHTIKNYAVLFRSQKSKALQKYLAQKGLAPLTEEEISRVENRQTAVSRIQSVANRSHLIRNLFISALVFLAIALIF